MSLSVLKLQMMYIYLSTSVWSIHRFSAQFSSFIFLIFLLSLASYDYLIFCLNLEVSSKNIPFTILITLTEQSRLESFHPLKILTKGMIVTASKQNLPFMQYRAILYRFLTGFLVFSSQYSMMNCRQLSEMKMVSNTLSIVYKTVPSQRPKAHIYAYRKAETILTKVFTRFQIMKNVLVLSMMYRSYQAFYI